MREMPTGSTLSDNELVMDALWGSPDAFVAIHDRYCDEIHDLCWSYLRRRETAAEAAHRTWAAAVDRLWRLREPGKLRSWLHAVTHEQLAGHVGGHRSSSPDVVHAGGPRPSSRDTVPDARGTAPSVLRELLWDDACGLTRRDRRTLALHLGDGLHGPELARAIGVRADRCDAALTKLRDRVDRTLGGLLVARLARSECAALDQRLQGWNGIVSPAVRRNIRDHVDGCDECGPRREALSPWSLLTVVPVALAPEPLRDAVRRDLVEAATSRAAIPLGDEQPAGEAAGDPAPADPGAHRSVRRGADRASGRKTGSGAAMFSGTSRTVAALVVAAGMAGSATLGMSNASWVTAVRQEAQAVREMLADLGGESPGSDRLAGSDTAAGPVGPGVVPGTPDAFGAPGAAIDTDGDGVPDAGIPFFEPFVPSGLPADLWSDEGAPGGAEFPGIAAAPVGPGDVPIPFNPGAIALVDPGVPSRPAGSQPAAAAAVPLIPPAFSLARGVLPIVPAVRVPAQADLAVSVPGRAASTTPSRAPALPVAVSTPLRVPAAGPAVFTPSRVPAVARAAEAATTLLGGPLVSLPVVPGDNAARRSQPDDRSAAVVPGTAAPAATPSGPSASVALAVPGSAARSAAPDTPPTPAASRSVTPAIGQPLSLIERPASVAEPAAEATVAIPFPSAAAAVPAQAPAAGDGDASPAAPAAAARASVDVPAGAAPAAPAATTDASVDLPVAATAARASVDVPASSPDASPAAPAAAAAVDLPVAATAARASVDVPAADASPIAPAADATADLPVAAADAAVELPAAAAPLPLLGEIAAADPAPAEQAADNPSGNTPAGEAGESVADPAPADEAGDSPPGDVPAEGAGESVADPAPADEAGDNPPGDAPAEGAGESTSGEVPADEAADPVPVEEPGELPVPVEEPGELPVDPAAPVDEVQDSAPEPAPADVPETSADPAPDDAAPETPDDPAPKPDDDPAPKPDEGPVSRPDDPAPETDDAPDSQPARPADDDANEKAPEQVQDNDGDGEKRAAGIGVLSVISHLIGWRR